MKPIDKFWLYCTGCGVRASIPLTWRGDGEPTEDKKAARCQATTCAACGKIGLFRMEREEKTRVKFVGGGISVVSDPIYHRDNCRWVAKLNVSELVEFTSKAEAEFRGYRACHVCRP